MTEAEYLEALSVLIKHNKGEPVDVPVYMLSKGIKAGALLQLAKDDQIVVSEGDTFRIDEDEFLKRVILHQFSECTYRTFRYIFQDVRKFTHINSKELLKFLEDMCLKGLLTFKRPYYSNPRRRVLLCKVCKKTEGEFIRPLSGKGHLCRQCWEQYSNAPAPAPESPPFPSESLSVRVHCDKCGFPSHEGRVLHNCSKNGPLGRGAFCGDCLAKGVSLDKQPTIEKPSPLANNHAWATPCDEWP